KFVEFLGARLPVIASAAARNASVTIEMFSPGVVVPPSPLSAPHVPIAPSAGREPLSSWWAANATAQTEQELDYIGRGSLLIVRSDEWNDIVFLSRLGWAASGQEETGLISEGQIRRAVVCSLFTLRTDLIRGDSGFFMGGWVKLHDPRTGKHLPLISLRRPESSPATIEFIKSLAAGVQAESASFAQQRKTLRALTARIDGADAASSLMPSDGSLSEIQRAAAAALAALSGALAIADTASC
ncbi:MAG: hypothetical protein ACKO0W_12650, partial [Planctomycetota bacterium]